jgi:hypothetical protein
MSFVAIACLMVDSLPVLCFSGGGLTNPYSPGCFFSSAQFYEGCVCVCVCDCPRFVEYQRRRKHQVCIVASVNM